MNKNATKIHNLKEKIFSRYHYLQPKKINNYHLGSIGLETYVNEYAYFLHHKIMHMKKTEGKLGILALKIRKNELEIEIEDLKKFDSDLHKKKEIFLNVIVKVIDGVLKGNKKWQNE